MNLDNCFYGFTKDGNEHILLKKYRTDYTSLGDVSYTIYYDLVKKKEYENFEVDEKTLHHISELVGIQRRMLKRRVVHLYLADRFTLFNTNDIFYGDIVKVDDKNKSYDTLRNNVLFSKNPKIEFGATEIETGHTYLQSKYIDFDLCVSNERPIKIYESKITKRKLLEMDYRKKL